MQSIFLFFLSEKNSILKKIFLTLFVSSLLHIGANAQDPSYVQVGEVGVTIGTAHYFGDLNTRAALNRPKPSLGLYFRKQFGNYIGVRIAGRYAQLGYSDQYSKNEYQRWRNLSFNTNIWEVALQGDFNFFKFVPNDPDYLFTPYITLGVGLFSYDPYAFIDGQKEYLRPLGTEGQTIGYMGRKEYSTMSFSIPFGVGIKYNVSDKFNVSFEVAHRFTGTDYIDDVSTTYIGADKFPAGPYGPTPASLLQDRSYEIDPGNIIGVEGRQRGFSKQKDQFIIAEIGISYNLSNFRCPTP